MKVVIVGGVAGGASAAARIRRLDEDAQIIMIERSGFVSYANCGLPYYVGGVIEDQEVLTLQTPESFWRRFRIDVRVQQEVTSIDPEKKSVTVHAYDSDEIYTETYDKLLLAPGARPTVPTLSGVDNERVFTLRTVEDTLRIRRFVKDYKPKTAVLAGGGFISLEMAENLLKLGVSATIVQSQNQLLTTLDADMASFVHAQMRAHGIDLRLGAKVEGFRQDGDFVHTLLDGGESLTSDMVLLAIGVTPDQQINSITQISENYNPYFLYYWLSTKKEYLFSIASVTRTPILSKGIFEEIEIPSISRLEQDKIAKALSALDRKIELNSEINDNLAA